MKSEESVQALVMQAIETLSNNVLAIDEKCQEVFEINRRILHQVNLEQYYEAVFEIVNGFYHNLVLLTQGSSCLSSALEQIRLSFKADYLLGKFESMHYLNCARICRDILLYQKLIGKSRIEMDSILSQVYLFEAPLSDEMKEEIEILIQQAF